MISSESVEANRAMGLRSPIQLDQVGMSVGSQFGATGTPMAILVDEEGKIRLPTGGGCSSCNGSGTQPSHARLYLS